MLFLKISVLGRTFNLSQEVLPKAEIQTEGVVAIDLRLLSNCRFVLAASQGILSVIIRRENGREKRIGKYITF